MKSKRQLRRQRQRDAGQCIQCGRVNPRMPKLCCQPCGDILIKSVRRRRRLAKVEAFEAYGGAACACCGESTLAFLTIDHIDGGGNAERKARGGAANIYFHLRKKGYPKGYQVLCFNCNSGKWINGGVCPHKDAVEVRNA